MSLSTLQTRIDWLGGDQLQRINKQKLRSLMWALKNDYNSRLIKNLTTGQNIQALINADNLKPDYDRKIISVPFDANFESGDVFECLDDGTRWMIYLPHLTETAYFHADIIRCRYQLIVNDTAYDIYFQGMTETTIPWRQKRGVAYNELNWSGTVFIKNNEETKDYFDRFTKIKIDGKPYEVEVVDRISVPGIIELELLEDFTNTVEDLPSIVLTEINNNSNNIIGKNSVIPGEKVSYTISKELIADDAEWSITDNEEVVIVESNKEYCTIKVGANAINTFTIQYGEDYNKEITIKESTAAIIKGNTEVYPYDVITYTLADPTAIGTFNLNTTKAFIVNYTSNSCTIEILTGKQGTFDLTVTINNEEFIIPITILSF